MQNDYSIIDQLCSSIGLFTRISHKIRNIYNIIISNNAILVVFRDYANSLNECNNQTLNPLQLVLIPLHVYLPNEA